MINPKVFLTYLLALAIFFHPLDLYRIDVFGFPLSMSRVFIGIVILLSIALLFSNILRIQRHKANIIILLYLFVPLILTIFRIENTGIFYFLFYGVFVFLIVQLVREQSQQNILLRAFELSFVLYVFFGFYTYFYFFYYGFPAYSLPFSSYIPIDFVGLNHIKEKQGFMVNFGSFPLPRLTYPLHTPPATSLALSLGIITFFLDKTLMVNHKKRAFRMIMMLLLLVFLLLTMSKSGFLMLIFAITFFSTIHVLINKSVSKKTFPILLSAIPLIILIFIYLPVDTIFIRLMSWEAMEGTVERHFQTRLEALSIAFENVNRFLFGVGYGNYNLYGSGLHSHSPVTTKLVELGVIGSLFFWAIYIYATLANGLDLNKKYRFKNEYNYKDSLHTLYFVGGMSILFSSLLYEAIAILPIYIFLALSLASVTVRAKL